MSSALSIAAGGMRAATVRFESAAHDIVRAGAEAQNALNAGSEDRNAPTQAPDPALSGGAPVSVPGLGLPDLATSLVSLKEAEISYKASVKVFEVASRLENELLDILA